MEKKRKYLVIVILLLSTLILISTIIFMGITIEKQIRIDDLYKQSRGGIFIEDRFLEHGEIVTCGNDSCAEWGNGFYFNFYGKTGDWVHYHFISWSNSFRVSTEITHMEGNTQYGILNLLTGWGFYSMDKELEWTGIYTVRIHNYDMEDSGHIKVFIIVYDEYYPPECPLC